MIHIIFGAPGKGKSCKQVHFAKELFEKNGMTLMSSCRSKIDKARSYGYPLSYPDRIPIFTDFPMIFKSGFRKTYSPYYINGYYLGLPNDDQNVMFVPPGAVIFLSEAQRYYYSRQSKSFPTWVSRFYEMHRHFGLEIYMDVQRPILIDANIRELCEHFIEIVELNHEINSFGRVISTTWICREWTSWAATAEYLAAPETKNYAETSYFNSGNIFDCYDSFSYFENFLPHRGQDFDYFLHADIEAQQAYSDYYNLSEPKTYRGGKK